MFQQIFSKSKNRLTVIGMIHLKALPGSPKSSLSFPEIIEHALQEANMYSKQGIDGIMIENMNDVPYTTKSSPETTAMFTRIAREIRHQHPQIPLGIQILATRNKEALAAAVASQSDFIRVENYVYSHVADEGMVNSDAASLLRFRKMIDGEKVAILTDVKKKHSSHAITSDVDIQETAKTAEFFLSDGLIITGASTGSPAGLGDVDKVISAHTNLPVIIGSGVTAKNAGKFHSHGAEAVIVGSYFKKTGHWSSDLDECRIKKFMDVIYAGSH